MSTGCRADKSLRPVSAGACERPLLALLRSEIEWLGNGLPVGIDSRSASKGTASLKIVGPLRQDCLKLIETLLGRVVAPESRAPVRAGQCSDKARCPDDSGEQCSAIACVARSQAYPQ